MRLWVMDENRGAHAFMGADGMLISGPVRTPTDVEVIEAARNIEGVIEAHLPDIAMYAEDNIVVPAGNYLVVPLGRTGEPG